MISRTRCIAYGNKTLARDRDLRLDDVLFPIALGGGDIAWQTEVLKGGKGDVVCAANAGFQHSPAPDGDVVLLANIVHLRRFGETAYAAHFGVDSPARAGFQGG